MFTRLTCTINTHIPPTYVVHYRMALLTHLRWKVVAQPGWAAPSMSCGFLAPCLYHATWHDVTEGAAAARWEKRFRICGRLERCMVHWSRNII